jgi:hypothetical protein
MFFTHSNGVAVAYVRVIGLPRASSACSASPTDIAYFFPQPNSFFLKEIVVPILLCCRFVLGGRLASVQRRRNPVIASQAIFCLLYRLTIARLCEHRFTKREEHDQRYTYFHLHSLIA